MDLVVSEKGSTVDLVEKGSTVDLVEKGSTEGFSTVIDSAGLLRTVQNCFMATSWSDVRTPSWLVCSCNGKGNTRQFKL